MTSHAGRRPFHAADLDDITGIPHASVFNHLIRDAVGQADPGSCWLVELIIDDLWGPTSHEGTDLHRMAAGLLTTAARRTDHVGYTGPGQVGLLLVGIDLPDAEGVAERLRQRVGTEGRITVRLLGASSVVEDRPG